MFPVHLLLDVLKFLKVKTIISFSLINEDTFIIYLNNKDYLARLKLKECGLSGGNFNIYINIEIHLPLKKEKINYYNILTKNAANGYIPVVKYLVELGVDINFNSHTDFDDDPFYISCINDHIAIVKYLVFQGANISNLDDAIISSAENGHLSIVKYLFDLGADIHYDSDDALYQSVINGHLLIVKYLVSKGADINIISDDTLKLIASKGHVEIVRFLIGNGLKSHANVIY